MLGRKSAKTEPGKDVDHFEGVRQLWKGNEMKIKDVTDKANEALSSAEAWVERRRLTRWALVLLAVAFVAALVLWATKAAATGYEHGGSASAIAGASAISGSSSSAVVSGAPVTVNGDSTSSRAFGLGMAGLAGSGNGCTESFSVAVVAGSWMTAVCKLAHELAIIESMPITRAAKDQAKLSASCKYDFVANAVSECSNRR